MRHFALLLLFFGLVTCTWGDDEKSHHHHEDLTETQLGTVHFPVSCAASAQKPFARGVALLHSFWYEEAEKEFADLAKQDPKCAMAHWGSAMSIWHQLWDNPSPKVIAHGKHEVTAAKNLEGSVTAWEKGYINAIAAF